MLLKAAKVASLGPVLFPIVQLGQILPVFSLYRHCCPSISLSSRLYAHYFRSQSLSKMDSATMLHPRPLRTHPTIDQAELESLGLPQDVLRAPPPSPEVQDPLSVAPQHPSTAALSLPVTEEETTSPPDIKFSPEEMDFDGPIRMQWTPQPDMAVDNASLCRMRFQAPDQFPLGQGTFYPHSRNGLSFDNNHSMLHASQFANAGCPRSHPGMTLAGLPSVANMSVSYPPAMLQIEPQNHYDTISEHGTNDHLMQSRDDFDYQHGTNLNSEYHGSYDSPDSDFTRASTPNDDDLLQQPYSLNSGDEMVVDKEQPYAQLIYQALLQADGNTMILKDIYDWFLRYTDKASGSETKGWQNSIRHNLSMNGVSLSSSS